MSKFNYELNSIKLEYEDDGSENKTWDFKIIINNELNQYSIGDLTFKQQDNKMIISPKLYFTNANIASGTAKRFLQDLLAKILNEDPVFNFIDKGLEISFNKNMYTTMLLEMSNIGKDIIIK